MTSRCLSRRFGSLELTLEFAHGTNALVSVRFPDEPPAPLNALDVREALVALQCLPIPPPRSAADLLFRSALASVPPGETRTYGQIARTLGTSPRAIGARCAANPLLLRIPCHRIVAANGPGGFRAGLSWKNTLLELERHRGVFPTVSDLSPRLF